MQVPSSLRCAKCIIYIRSPVPAMKHAN